MRNVANNAIVMNQLPSRRSLNSTFNRALVISMCQHFSTFDPAIYSHCTNSKPLKCLRELYNFLHEISRSLRMYTVTSIGNKLTIAVFHCNVVHAHWSVALIISMLAGKEYSWEVQCACHVVLMYSAVVTVFLLFVYHTHCTQNFMTFLSVTLLMT